MQSTMPVCTRFRTVFDSMTAGFFVTWVALTSLVAMGSDVQRSTDESAVEAKKALCMALNQKQDTSRLATLFFDFYEGKTISSRYLNPQTFRTGQLGPISSFEVVQVVSPDRMLARIDGGMFFVEGVPTVDIADDQDISPKQWFQVCETETYTTVANFAKTVYVLRPCPDSKLPKITATRTYPWYDKKDNVVLTGEFKRIEGSKAVFAVDGVEETHALSKFTQGDRDVLRMIWKRYPPDEPASTAPQATPSETEGDRSKLD